jgi:hypothetical protein
MPSDDKVDLGEMENVPRKIDQNINKPAGGFNSLEKNPATKYFAVPTPTANRDPRASSHPGSA